MPVFLFFPFVGQTTALMYASDTQSGSVGSRASTRYVGRDLVGGKECIEGLCSGWLAMQVWLTWLLL